MCRIFILCVIVLVFASEGLARQVEPGRDLSFKLFLTDLLDIKTSRYCEGRSYSRFPKAEKKLRILPLLHPDLWSILYSAEHSFVYTVQPDDSLRKIARQHGTTIEYIKARNKLKDDHLRSDRKLLLGDWVFTIEVNKTFNRLYLMAEDVLIREYPVSTGKADTQTPLGVFFIQTRYPYPTWFHKGTIVPGGSADNYLGSRWLGFDKPQFGLHGTIFPELIGQAVSGGCIRMKNEDIEEIYEFIPIGTTIIISEI